MNSNSRLLVVVFSAGEERLTRGIELIDRVVLRCDAAQRAHKGHHQKVVVAVRRVGRERAVKEREEHIVHVVHDLLVPVALNERPVDIFGLKADSFIELPDGYLAQVPQHRPNDRIEFFHLFPVELERGELFRKVVFI